MGDGLFEVMLIRAPRNLTEVTDCLIAAKTQNYDCGMVTFRTAKSVKITADPFMSWSLDGEKADGYTEITVENLHQAIKIVKRVN
jgi:diacylglycerol kinase family enzyme